VKSYKKKKKKTPQLPSDPKQKPKPSVPNIIIIIKKKTKLLGSTFQTPMLRSIH